MKKKKIVIDVPVKTVVVVIIVVCYLFKAVFCRCRLNFPHVSRRVKEKFKITLNNHNCNISDKR